MPYYVLELRDSDGNDCRVYDLLIGPCENTDQAYDRAGEYIEETWLEDESDGDTGTFHPCDCECEHGCSPWDDDAHAEQGIERCCGDTGWECSHGGVWLADEAKEYPTENAARQACASYHTRIELVGG